MSPPREPLTRARIVDAAVRLIEREGVEAVSMRRLAAELGAGTMSLYNHVPNKAVLVDLAAERIMADARPYQVDSDDWRDHIRAHARAVRELARRHPRAFVMLATRRLSSEAGFRTIEAALANFDRAGFRGRVAVGMMRAMVSYLLGTLMREVATSPELGGIALSPYEDVDMSAFPLSAGVMDELGTYDHDQEFEFGLELLIAALERYRS
ncbi:TetR/AcrR family transcriptional regulator C-terminal domain-containing protein [Lentzea sp. DG1S-22]|uniref:TetR/AcrR family transcriptional regulator C-terminal domain-containing protein n=1 Tax=Lentzea sp. DG1S-22 TaxID=3108822 RepID=UPI002E792C7A|nr:TetR/AcrR family transcriptional regulator C-terminal domain-containing protein [Lentzea sp. DG1S-22]WVH77735.1 TetR/AcrR family transcriptional regulator C-terminal domain-containing protein [Lentzea sp. DG1S-22]